MQLLLLHGRFDATEPMSEWGFAGPILSGVEAIHVTYQQTFVIWFSTDEACTRAQALTGWSSWDRRALELNFHDDVLQACPIALDGPLAFYGDYELQEAS